MNGNKTKTWRKYSHTQLIDSHKVQRDTSQNQQNGFARRRRLPTMAATRQSSRRSAQEWLSPNLYQPNFTPAHTYCEILRYYVTVFDTAGYWLSRHFL